MNQLPSIPSNFMLIVLELVIILLFELQMVFLPTQ